MNSLPIGTKIQSPKTVYTITGILGSGGFGITYSATYVLTVDKLRIKAGVALKEHFVKADCQRDGTTSGVMYSEPARDRVERSKKDFMGEARRLRELSGKNPNIVTVSEVFEANNTAYYAMELLEGVSLKDYVDSRGPLSEGEMLAIMKPIIGAVAFLHRNHITHLDIKPHNIMLTTDDEGRQRPVLIDFGLSKHYDADGNATSTINTQGFSDGYAPTEQYRGISTFSPASDVYSLGATMLFCLTGRRLPCALDVKADTLDGYLLTTLSPALRRTLTKALERHADDRTPDGQRLLDELSDVTTAEASTVNLSFPDRKKTTEIVEVEVQPVRKNRRWLVATIVLIVLLIGGLVGYLLTKGGGNAAIGHDSDTVKRHEAPAPPVVLDEEVSTPEPASEEADEKAQEIDRLKAEGTRLKAEDEARLKAEKEAKKKAEEEARKKTDEKVKAGFSPYLHSTPKNFDLCVTWKGKTGYISESEWKKMSSAERSQCSKRGIYLSGNGQRFLLALNDLQSDGLTWDDAVARYGSRLPSMAQGEVISKNVTSINQALKAFGGQSMGSDWFWTRDEKSSASAWFVGMNGGFVNYNYKNGAFRVRAVAPVPESSAM